MSTSSPTLGLGQELQLGLELVPLLPVAVVCYFYDPIGCCSSYFPGSQHWRSFLLIPLPEEECSLLAKLVR